MPAEVPTSLREKYQRLLDALLNTPGSTPEASSPATPSPLAALAAGEVTTDAQAKQLLTTTADIPENARVILVVKCSEKGSIRQVRDRLTETGFSIVSGIPHAEMIAKLGMLAIRIPPVPALLDYLATLDEVSSLSDGEVMLGHAGSPGDPGGSTE